MTTMAVAELHSEPLHTVSVIVFLPCSANAVVNPADAPPPHTCSGSGEHVTDDAAAPIPDSGVPPGADHDRRGNVSSERVAEQCTAAPLAWTCSPQSSDCIR